MSLRESGDPAFGAADTAPGADDTLTREDARPFVGRSRAIRRVRAQLARAAARDVPVLLVGEPGSGRRAAARRIHALSARARGPFRVVPATVPAALLAHALQETRGGTLYVEDVANLDREAQALLARPPRTDCRVIAATAADLRAKVDAAELDESLVHELSRCRITLPALRDRREDLPRLARLAVAEHATGGAAPRILSPATLEVLRRHSWPGNLPELEEALRAAASAGGSSATIEPQHLPEAIRHAVPSLDMIAIPVGTTLEEAERTILARTLEAYDGKKNVVARVLGISRSALYAKLDRLDLR